MFMGRLGSHCHSPGPVGQRSALQNAKTPLWKESLYPLPHRFARPRVATVIPRAARLIENIHLTINLPSESCSTATAYTDYPKEST